MTSVPEQFRLLGGPYRAPQPRADGCLRCAIRGWTKVDGYTEAHIPWPAKWGRSPILCGDLIRAVRREAKATVAYHWGVSVITVYKWRKFLGVPEWNEGSADLLSRARKKPAAAGTRHTNSYALVKAANPRRRSQEFVKRMRETTLARLKEVGTLHPGRSPWTPEEDRLLGTLSDQEVADLTNRSRKAVMTRRRRLRKKCPTSSWTHWTPAQVELLGTKSDAELAKPLHRQKSAITAKRAKLRVAPPLRPTMRDWSPEEEALLGVESDEVIAQKTKRTVNCVSAHRRWLGIAAPTPKLRRWTPKEDQIASTGSPHDIARRLKRTVTAVMLRRKILAELRKPWTSQDDQLLGTAPDAEIARRIGRSRPAVRARRMTLEIACYQASLRRRYWSADEDQLVGTMPDDQLAHQLARSTDAVRQRRFQLGRGT